MQYYNKYIEDKDLLINYGTLLKDENDNYIIKYSSNKNKSIDNNNIQDPIENNRGIIGDIVYIHDNKVINIRERSSESIVGILDTESHIKYGMLKDKPLYLFKPTNKKYGYFYVPYKNEKQRTTVNNKFYCIIQFKEWNTTNKYPIGTLMESIGSVGDIDAEFEHLRNYYNLRKNTWKLDKTRVDADILQISQLQTENHDYSVFSIDPLHSKDIDDAFHFNITKDYYEVGVHIANPTMFFKQDLDHILEERISTVYLPNRKFNMLPNMYADNICSLIERTKRYALSVVFKINKKTEGGYMMDNVKIMQTVVYIEKNYDYDTFDAIYKKNDMLLDFMIFSEEFFNNIGMDSHKLVEEWMIYTNKYVAKYLIENNYENSILRVHQSNKENGMNEEILNNKNELNDYLKIYGESSAFYELYDNKKLLIQHHDKMDNSYYTHFTSPIRRSIDMYIHYLLTKKMDATSPRELQIFCNMNEKIEKMNQFVKSTRKLDRMCKRLNFLNEINFESCITYGYIIKIGINKLTIYIPEYKLEENVFIIRRKMNSLYNLQYEYVNSEDQIINRVYYNNEENMEISYRLYDKLNLQLWVFLNEENIFDKLTIQIGPE